VLLAHVPSGANWVLSTVLLQRRAQARFHGRVFATELQLVTLADTVTIVVASSSPCVAWLSSTESSSTRKPATSATVVVSRARPTSVSAACRASS